MTDSAESGNGTKRGNSSSGTERYIICENCGGHEDGWSVKVDENGEVTTVECRDCGGSDWYRRSW